MSVVCFGDSITYGEHVPREKTWPALLGYQNKGVCSDTTRLALERFPADVQASGAETVLIQFGFNDCNRWDTDGGLPRVSPQAFKANLLEMVDRAKAFGIVPVLVSTFKTAKNGRYETDRIRYHDIIASAGTFAKVRVIDPEPYIFLEHLLADGKGCHLNEQGHVAFAEIVRG